MQHLFLRLSDLASSRAFHVHPRFRFAAAFALICANRCA